jgi:hypothetical protein
MNEQKINLMAFFMMIAGVKLTTYFHVIICLMNVRLDTRHHVLVGIMNFIL